MEEQRTVNKELAGSLFYLKLVVLLMFFALIMMSYVLLNPASMCSSLQDQDQVLTNVTSEIPLVKTDL